MIPLKPFAAMTSAPLPNYLDGKRAELLCTTLESTPLAERWVDRVIMLHRHQRDAEFLALAQRFLAIGVDVIPCVTTISAGDCPEYPAHNTELWRGMGERLVRLCRDIGTDVGAFDCELYKSGACYADISDYYAAESLRYAVPSLKELRTVYALPGPWAPPALLLASWLGPALVHVDERTYDHAPGGPDFVQGRKVWPSLLPGVNLTNLRRTWKQITNSRFVVWMEASEEQAGLATLFGSVKWFK